ncbi:MAG: AAA family ATPase, partial [Thermoplasmata archaeon]|nr:AAA family ATPase [Thermoplasmata archaeon]
MEGDGIRGDVNRVQVETRAPERDNIFHNYIKTDTVFADREILLPSHIPERILYRDEQINQLASILAIALKGEKPSNVLIFGKTGTGKTATVKYLGNEMGRLKGEGKADFIYLNCEFFDTPYSIIQHIGNLASENFDERIPFTGLSMQKLYSMLKERMDSEKRVVILVLDEIDKLVKKSGDDILYHLYEINEELAKSRI